jgi:hypothetical protein
MPLFIDRLPFHRWTDQTHKPPSTYWAISLPAHLTEVGLPAPPVGAPVLDWFLDTGHAADAFAWRHHLALAGLDHRQRLAPGAVVLTSAMGARIMAPIRTADLWLVSNVGALRGHPIRLRLERGLPFRDVPSLPDPRYHRPLIGMRALRGAGLRVEIDFAADVVSISTP